MHPASPDDASPATPAAETLPAVTRVRGFTDPVDGLPCVRGDDPVLRANAMKFGVDADALAHLINVAAPKVIAGMSPEAAIVAAHEEIDALLREIAFEDSPRAKAARRVIAEATYEEIRRQAGLPIPRSASAAHVG